MDCIHCGACTRSCEFLGKYHMDLEEFSHHPELAYHCFLCGECTACCPKNIDGRQIALELRAGRILEAGSFRALPEAKQQRLLLLEKKNYLFRNYRGASSGPVLFPGCNFPSFYPRTTAHLSRLLWETAGIGTVLDCCGKPIYELGLEKESEAISRSLTARLRRAGVTEVIVMCPNCYAFLREHLELPVVPIYEKLRRLKLVEGLEREEFPMFLPCPDRHSREMLKSALPLLKGPVRSIRGIQCCGLGGCAAACEPELAAGFARKLQDVQPGTVYTYCASCAGNLTRGGAEDVRHILVELLGTGERPAEGIHSLLNRAMGAFRSPDFHVKERN